MTKHASDPAKQLAYSRNPPRIPRCRDVLTTGQVAVLCRVAPRTVTKWFDSGKLQGYRIPGSQDRRIPRANVIRFLKENGMPLDGLGGDAYAVLVIGADARLTATLRERLPEADVAESSSAFAAGCALTEGYFDTVIFDFRMGRADCLHIASVLRADPARARMRLVALPCEDEPDVSGLRDQFDTVFQAPFDVTLLAEMLVFWGEG